MWPQLAARAGGDWLGSAMWHANLRMTVDTAHKQARSKARLCQVTSELDNAIVHLLFHARAAASSGKPDVEERIGAHLLA